MTGAPERLGWLLPRKGLPADIAELAATTLLRPSCPPAPELRRRGVGR